MLNNKINVIKLKEHVEENDEEYSDKKIFNFYSDDSRRELISKRVSYIMKMKNDRIPPKGNFSLFLLSERNKFRKLMVNITASRIFNVIILLAVLLSTLTLVMNQPSSNDNSSSIDIFSYVELGTVILFCIEFIFKVIALGFALHPGSYMRSTSNIFDFFILVAGIISLDVLKLGSSISVLKSLKAFRTLRLIELTKFFPCMKATFWTLDIMFRYTFADIFILILVTLFTAIIMLNEFYGQLSYVCADIFTGNITSSIFLQPRSCGIRSTSYKCSDKFVCSLSNKWGGPYYGAIQIFDLIQTMYACFLTVTTEGWSELMVNFLDAADRNIYYAWIYFIPLSFFGNYILLNVISGITCGLYTYSQKMLKELRDAKKDFHKLTLSTQLPIYLSWIDQGKTAVIDKLELELDQMKNIPENNTVSQDKAERQRFTEPLVNLVMPSKKMIKLIKANLALSKQRFSSIIKSVWFMLFDSCVIICCVLSAASLHPNQPSWLTFTQYLTDLITRGLFILILLSRILCFEMKEIKDVAFIFDILFTLGGAVDIVLLLIFGYHYSFATLRIYFLISFLSKTGLKNKYRSYFGPLKKSAGPLMGLLLINFVLVTVFALIGMGLFGTGVETLTEAYSARFDGFFDAMITSFQVFVSAKWVAIANDAIKYYNITAFGVVFVIFVIIGDYIFSAFSLAVLADNLLIRPKDNIADNANKLDKRTISWKNDLPVPKYTGATNDDDPKLSSGFKIDFLIDYIEALITFPGLNRDALIKTKTLFIFSDTNRFRLFLYRITISIYYDFMTVIAIIISLILIAIDDPLQTGSFTFDARTTIDVVINALFILEMFIKTITLGLCLHRGAYLRNIWNITDVITNLISIVYIYISITYSDFIYFRLLKMLRLIRLLRLLKFAWRFPYFKDITKCVTGAINGALLSYWILLITIISFSCIGMRLYQGSMLYCPPGTLKCNDFYDVPFNSTSKASVQISAPDWFKYSYSFENMYISMKTLLVCSTNELWPSLMYFSIEKILINGNVIRRNPFITCVFYIIFAVINNFWIHKMVASYLLVSVRDTEKVDEFGLTINERECLYLSITSNMKKIYIPRDQRSFNAKVWKFANSKGFQICIMILILLNTAIYTIMWEGMPIYVLIYLWYAKIGFAGLFLLEALIKIYALKLSYFRDLFNIMDLIFLLLQIIYIIIMFTAPTIIPFDFGCFIVIRYFRILLFLQKYRPFFIVTRVIKETLAYIPYIFLLLLFIIYVYAIIGMQLFSSIQQSFYNPINEYYNFTNFLHTILLLYRVLTGEQWYEIMEHCATTTSCNPSSILGCSFYAAYGYFISFVLIVSFFLSNIFISIIVRSFEFLTNNESRVTKLQIYQFIDILSDFDHTGSGMISHTDLFQALKQMEPPFGVGKFCPLDIAYRRMTQINITIYRNNLVGFNEALFALVRTSLKLRIKNNNSLDNERNIMELIKYTWPEFKSSLIKRSLIIWQRIDSDTMSVAKIYTSKLLYYKLLQEKGLHKKIDKEITLSNPEEETKLNLMKLSNSQSVESVQKESSLSSTSRIETEKQKPEEIEKKDEFLPIPTTE